MTTSRGGGSLPSLLLVGLLALAPRPTWASVQTCPHDSIVVDLALTNSYFTVFDGRGVGQVFEARDTLLSSVSVWIQIPLDTLGFTIQLFLTTVDSTGLPNRDIILLGPVVRGGFGRTPKRVDFVLDPPFALPTAGKYFFVVNEESCFGEFNVLADTTNPYSNGETWRTGSTLCDGRGPGGLVRPSYPTMDLIFNMKFCDTTTPVRRRTWGDLKIRYR